MTPLLKISYSKKEMVKKAALPFLLLSFIFVFIVFYSNNAYAATANHLVISEVQISGINSTDDFVELFNPTDSAVDLADYRLVKRTSSGEADTSVVAFENGDAIPAHGYFLWCNTSLAETLTCDKSTGGTVSNNNSLGLRNGALNEGELVDAVTFGEVANSLGEGVALTAPDDNQSVERLSCGEDTDDNASDFVLRETPDPQNTASELAVCATPTETASATPTPTVEPTATPTMSSTPSPSASPTVEPTATAEPTMTPEPTTTPEPTVTPTPVPTISAGRIIAAFPSRGGIKVCRLEYKWYTRGFFSFSYPTVVCERITL